MSTKRIFRIENDIVKYVDINISVDYRQPHKEKNVIQLHNKFYKLYANEKILEVSTKSQNELGRKLSAFNLRYSINNKEYPLECIFQSSKVFEKGGPYSEFLLMKPWEVKRDKRLRNSGNLIGFKLNEVDYELEPKTLFYDWIYVNALYRRPDLYKKVIEYNAFSDIEFNPQRAINCQAKSVALFVTLYRRNILEEALSNIDIFKKYV